MKFLKIVSLAVVFVSCSHQPMSKEEISEYSYKRHNEIQDYVEKIVDNHNDYSDEQKTKLKETLKNSINKNRDLKVKESKVAQAFLDSLIAEKYNEKKVAQIKKEMHSIYEQKEQLLIKTSSQIKEIVGVKEDNHYLTLEVEPFMH